MGRRQEHARIEGDREPRNKGVPDSLSPSILACSLSPSIVALAPRRSQGARAQELLAPCSLTLDLRSGSLDPVWFVWFVFFVKKYLVYGISAFRMKNIEFMAFLILECHQLNDFKKKILNAHMP